MATLGVNIDHVATVRQARRADEPDPVWAAVEAQLGGADCITFHLREDRRHIIDRDVPLLKSVVTVKLNMEMAAAPEIVEIACTHRPDQCTLVPEKREEITTEGGLDVGGMRRRLGDAVQSLKREGITVSAFIEPLDDQIAASAEAGFDAVELWTGGYANAREPAAFAAALERLRAALRTASAAGLAVHAGHGLTYRNVHALAAVPGFGEFNIGHSIVARAVFVGMRQAVAEMKRILIQHERMESTR
jgi:pyridoxine 5-phosphate synthase